MQSYLAAAIQLNSGPDLEKNLAQARQLIEAAADQGARLVALPENFPFLGPDDQKIREVESIWEASHSFLAKIAKGCGITLLGGGFPAPSGRGKILNMSVLIDPLGTEVARYCKMHLFDVDLPDGAHYRESDVVQAGTEFPPVYRSDDLGNIGLSICYDVRFPELYRHLSAKGADILMVPAAFTAFTGQYHWELLLRARAVENTCYVVAAAQTGLHFAHRSSHGHSMIVDPWGTILADAGTTPGIAMATIDPGRLAEVRRQMPSLNHRIIGRREKSAGEL
jgi:predicted amidohydrolase